MQPNRISYLSYLICFLASMFYLYEFILQVSPSVMTAELMHDFSVDAAGMGLISALYYYAYTPMQLPAGLLYDRFGPRRVLTVAILICAAGTILFSLAHSVLFAFAGRFLMGAGSAFSFVGVLVLVSRWFPAQYFAMIAGIVQLMSSIGAISGQIPIAATVDHFGWRHTLSLLSIAGLVLAFFVWLIVKDSPSGKTISVTVEKGELQRLHYVLGKWRTWFIGIYSFASWGPVVVFAALWGIPYLAQRYGISITEASEACSMVWLGIGIGSPLVGWWSNRIGKRRLPLIMCPLMGLIATVGVLYLPSVSFAWMSVFLFIFGLAAAGQSLAFAVVKDYNPDHVVGTAIGFNNMAVVLTGIVFQPLAGMLLRHFWNGQLVHGVPYYTVSDYKESMIIIPFCCLLGLIMSLFFIKETHCQKVYQE